MTHPKVGIVVVSHSRALARAATALAEEMVHDNDVTITTAAGLDEETLGTDATQIVEAIIAADRGAGVVVLMDLGSAVLSAEMALELLDDDARQRVHLSPAPLVEGLIVGAVTAAGGATLEEVATECLDALAGKTSHLGPAPTSAVTEDVASDGADAAGNFLVANTNGLHARPAARLVQVVRSSGARVEIRNRTTESPWVAADSLSKVATLGVRFGHEVEIRAWGARATDTVLDILELAHRSFDEPADDTPSVPVSATAAQRPIGASVGLAIGPARTARSTRIEIPDVPAQDPATEWARVERAVAVARSEIADQRNHTARSVGANEATIFDAHLLLLDDPDLLTDVRGRIDDGIAAPNAWAAATGDVADQLQSLADPYQQARAGDVTAVRDQVLTAMLPAASTAEAFDADTDTAAVLVAADLTPAQAASVTPATVSAVLLGYGSPTAHSVILLRAKGIPVIVNAGIGVLDIPQGTLLTVDGGSGEFTIAPSAQEAESFRARVEQAARQHSESRARSHAPARTRDGVLVPVGANIGSVDDARAAAVDGADYAGLVRTEFLFLDRPDAPDAEEQLSVYRKIAESLDGKRVTLRTLDIGGDKPVDFLPTATELNPFLGVRGIRLSLNNTDIFTEQLIAMTRLAYETPVSIMFPMISTVEELVAAREAVDAAIGQVQARGGRPPGLEVGIMVEVPTTALKSAVFAKYVDFFSIGTNDLTQYTMAADRGNESLAALSDPFDPGLLQLIGATCRGAAGSATVSVCGEFAADARATALLLGLGVGSLSVSPTAVPLTKDSVRSVDVGKARLLTESVVAAEGSAAVHRLMQAGERE